MSEIANIELQGLPTRFAPHMHICIVLTHDKLTRTYKAYMGGANMPDYNPDRQDEWDTAKQENADYIAACGNELSYKKACNYFSGIPQEAYRND